MYAKLIAFTKPIDPTFGSSLEEFIAYVARVSNPDNQWNHETASKLLRYLERNKHWSPFEMADVVIEVNTTRDIARQILRHRSFFFQEFSQRYAEVTEFSEPKESRLQDVDNRQNSLVDENEERSELWEEIQHDILQLIKREYNWALKNGIAKEVARVILPEGLTKSRLYMKGSVRSWLHYFEVRLDPSTQKEHREIAELMQIEFEKALTQ